VVGRDPERTPMQWDASPNAGFASADVSDLWLPLASNYKEVNVATQLEEPRSMLNFYRKLLAYRKASPALTWGSYRSLDLQQAEAGENCFVFERQTADQRLLVALNFSGQEQTLSLPELGKGRVVLSTTLAREGEVDLATLVLQANEGCMIEL
jgi:alpha-glucosidase